MAFVLTRVFLGIHALSFDPPETEAVVMVEALASGALGQAEFAAWTRKHSKSSL